MAAKPEIIRLKHSADSEASIIAAIAPGSTHPISRGELVIGVEADSAKLYTLSANDIPVPVVSGFPFGVDGGDFDLGSFPVLTGSRPPLLGSGPATNYTGWTRVVNQDNYFQSYHATMAFSIKFDSINYDDFFVNPFSLITFGADFTDFIITPPNESYPPPAKILIDTISNYYIAEYIQRVYIQSNQAYYRIRVEMDSSAWTPPGSSDRVYELTFVNPIYTANQLIELRTGGTGYSNRDGVFMLSGSDANLFASAPDILPGESWVFEGDSTGLIWSMTPYAHIDI